jgi:hypothetical protein
MKNMRNFGEHTVFDQGMRANHENDDSRMDDHDPVWRLLACAPRPEPDGWFAARTMARCRQAARQMEKGWAPFGRVWRWALGGGLGVCLAAVVTMTQIQLRPNPPAADDQKNVQEAFEIVANVGSDSDSASTSTTWPDSSL